MEELKIRGARIHNLKNINLTIPKHKLIIITGISGSGKSSLAFDIIFEEGKNQYLSSIGILSGFNQDDRFDSIEGIGPTVAVHQNTVRQNNPRSTVGSKTSILNQLALVFASDGKSEEEDHLSPSSFLYTSADGMCIKCQGMGSYYDINLELLVPDKTMTLLQLYEKLRVTSGFLGVLRRRYGTYFSTPFWELTEDIRDEVIYGTYDNGKQSYCIERILKNAYEKGEDIEEIYAKTECSDCHGERVGEMARSVLLHGKNIGELGQMTIEDLLEFLNEIPVEELSQFSINVVKSITKQLKSLIKFRLGHLSLYREMSSLSGGEIQRVFLHLHLESKLDSLIYVFDEPMAGLHPSEKASMIEAMKQLRDLGNTVIVVEHDKEMICHADHIIEIGPKAGAEGGNVVFQGDYEEYCHADTMLSKYLSGACAMPERMERHFTYSKEDCIRLEHANTHYLKDVSVEFPLHAMVGIAGLSGSGKSSLIEETLLKRLATAKKYGSVNGLSGEHRIQDYVTISQEPIGRSTNSTPASYIGIWDKIRELFAKQPKAVAAHMSAGHFSFHSKGSCPECNGSGYERIFLTSDFSVDKECPSCHGKRFCDETLAVAYKGKNISDVLDLSVTEALDFFQGEENIIRPLNILDQMGMGYLRLGQPSTSLSGGEAQRIKLTKELGQQRKSNILYVLDEPTTGLSMYDTAFLLKLLDQLVVSGNSVIVIEHNIEVLKKCDYLIELGPEGGERGGEIIAMGTPEQLTQNAKSITGRYLL